MTFSEYLKKKYPQIIVPDKLVSFIISELAEYAKEYASFKFHKIGTFFYKEGQLKFKSHKKIETYKEIDFSKIIKFNQVVINQISLGQQTNVISNIDTSSEESILADSDFNINDLF